MVDREPAWGKPVDENQDEDTRRYDKVRHEVAVQCGGEVLVRSGGEVATGAVDAATLTADAALEVSEAAAEGATAIGAAVTDVAARLSGKIVKGVLAITALS